MRYLALYRKYRPTRFSEVVGQDAVTRTLKNAVASGRVSHAYLFSGPRGTGKTSTAKILSLAVNCEHPTDGEPCRECPTCRALMGAGSADIFEYDAASNSRVDEMREILDKVMYPPTVGRTRVYILDEVHMLSSSAFNALLKTLEEPPEFAMFILATTEPRKVPATILSRCQRFDFRRIDTDIIAERLSDVFRDVGADVSDDATELIARLSEGGMRDALSLADQVIGMTEGRVDTADVTAITGGGTVELISELAGVLVRGDIGASLELLGDSLAAGGDPPALARELASYFRDVLVIASTDRPEKLIRRESEVIDKMREMSRSTDKPTLTLALTVLLEADGAMRNAASPRVTLETAMAKICMGADGGSVLEMQKLQKRVDILEEKLKNGAVYEADAGGAAAQQSPALAVPKKRRVPKAEPGKEWEEMLERLKRERIALHAALARSVDHEATDTRLTIYFDPDDMSMKVVSQKKNADTIKKTAEETYGRPLELKIEEWRDDDESTAIAKARELFGSKLTETGK